MRFSLLMIVALAVGCATHEKLPPVAWHSQAEALHILADRANQIRTVSAQGLLTMQRPDGQSVRLDLAMVRDREHHVRLRAWKLGRAVFDFTMTPDGIWMLMPDNPAIRDRVRDSQAPITRLADTFDVLDGALFSRPNTQTRESGNTLICSATVNGAPVRCEVDKLTLAPRRYIISDDHGVARFTMELSNYRLIDNIPFACKYAAVSDMGTITISLDDVELNSDLAPAAFTPPKRAEKVR
jgi:outer membrane lipoprotein-sorting protein